MKEKIKEFLKKINTNILIILLLIIIAILLFLQNRQLYKTIHYNRIANIEKHYFNKDREKDFISNFDKNIEKHFNRYFDQINFDFEKELINMKIALENNIREFKKIEDDFNNIDTIKNNKQEKNKNNKKEFIYYPKIENNDKEFILKMKLPKNLTINDIFVDIQNNNLILKTEKQENIKNKNSKSKYYSSFFENFQLPQTKATKKDIKIDLNKNNNELIIIVPIIK